MEEKAQLLRTIDRLHTTKLGVERIRRNIAQEDVEVVNWCKQCIISPKSTCKRKGKNYYVTYENYILTINAHSYTIITVHREKQRRK